ncbi:MAG: AAA domain-containing protein [Myxococcota bacterium]
MRWGELRWGREVQVDVRITVTTKPGLATRIEGWLRVALDTATDRYWIETPDGHLHAVIPAGGSAGLRDLADPGVVALVQAEPSAGDRLRVVGRIFPNKATLTTRMPLLVPPEIEEKISASSRGRLNDWFDAEFLVDGRAFAHAGGKPADGLRPFELWGRDRILAVERTPQGLTVTGLKRVRKHAPALTILEAPFDLLPGRQAVASEAIAQVEAAAKAGSGWWGLWAEYQRAEREVLEETRQRLTPLPYRSCTLEHNGEHVRFRLREAPPECWAAEEAQLELAVLVNGKEQAVGRLRAIEGAAILVELGQGALVPPDEGELTVAIEGDQKRLRRREDALDRLQRGQSQMPDLLAVLEGEGRTAYTGAERRPLSPATERLLAYPLTSAQRDAVRIALNTPDIALIQGPPGTGKTTVIRMITARLHEEGRTPVLLTSYQHEAVLRVLEGVETGGVPGVRIGGRRGEDPSVGIRPLTEWLERLQAAAAEAARDHAHDTPWNERQRRLWRLVNGWRSARGGKVGAHALLAQVREEIGAELPAPLAERLDAADVLLDTNVVTEALPEAMRWELSVLVSRLATTPERWSDDGPAGARRLERALRAASDELEHTGAIDPEVTSTLLRAGVCRDHRPAPPGLLDALSAVQAALDLRLAPPPPPALALAVPSEIDAALNAVLAWVDQRAAEAGEGISDALEGFLNRLLEDPLVLPRVLERYATAVGATVQQAVGREMSELHAEFDTVIVDEAARANPLDLLIALILGRRIVLVGDQNQLPHMLEPRLEAAVNSGRATDASAVLRQSLFARLWELYRECPPGGIPRTRLLDEQFRMHPIIGDFVSATFYGGAVRSATKAEDLQNTTALFDGRNVAFLNVKGRREQRRYERPHEAVVVADRVDLLLADAPDWTIGVITFYAQQAALLEEHAKARGWSERVRVGTVDAFQGREFDAVLLSCVRSGGGVGFLALPNRLNVAMSRAKRLLVAVGDARTVRQVAPLAGFLALCRERGFYDDSV